jgi:hypothetical protein
LKKTGSFKGLQQNPEENEEDPFMDYQRCSSKTKNNRPSDEVAKTEENKEEDCPVADVLKTL